MKLRTVLTRSGKALIHLIVVVCSTCMGGERAVKRKVAAILHVDKDQAGYLNVHQ